MLVKPGSKVIIWTIVVRDHVYVSMLVSIVYEYIYYVQNECTLHSDLPLLRAYAGKVNKPQCAVCGRSHQQDPHAMEVGIRGRAQEHASHEVGLLLRMVAVTGRHESEAIV